MDKKTATQLHIVLADLPRAEQVYDLSYPNLGILYLVSSLRKHFGNRIRITYLEGFCSLAEHLAALEGLKPDIYGVSFASITSQLAYRTINAVHERFPSLPIICGGAHPTARPEHVLRSSAVDLCVLGEGELTVCDVVGHYADDQPATLSEIPGIAFRAQNDVVRTRPRELIKDIDEIPYPAWDIIDFRKYSGMHYRKADPQTYILASRGCPFDCNFCSNPIWKLSKPWVRLRKPECIADEVKYLAGLGLREIYLSADEFNISTQWALDVAEAIAALKLDLYFQCNVRADKVNDELAAAFVRMNMWLVHLGIETGNQCTLDGIGKKITIEQIENAAATLRRHGIKIFGFFMLYHAWEENGELRFETPADVKNTLRFARDLFRRNLINYMSWHVATPFPGSRLWDLAERHRLLKSEDIIFDAREMAMDLPGITQRDINQMLRYGYMLKIYQALKSGELNWRHIWRGKALLNVIMGRRPSKSGRPANPS